VQNGINPQLIVAFLQGENGLITMKARPSTVTIQSLLGCGAGGLALNTAAQQIQCAADNLSGTFDTLLGGGAIQRNDNAPAWQVGVPTLTHNQYQGRMNPLEGLPITPANAASATMFIYTPYRGPWTFNGVAWGGITQFGGVSGKMKLWRQLGLWGVEAFYTGGVQANSVQTSAPQENSPHFINKLIGSGLSNAYQLPFAPQYLAPAPLPPAGAWDVNNGASVGIDIILPPLGSYQIQLDYKMWTWDWCGTGGDGSGWGHYDTGDCFVASLQQQHLLDFLSAQWQPQGSLRSAWSSSPGLINIWGGPVPPTVNTFAIWVQIQPITVTGILHRN
jgi:hypothetical protein